MPHLSGGRRRTATGLLLALSTGLAAAALAPLASATPAGDALVISEVYGGGGNSGATYTHDYVELYNPTEQAVDVSAMSVQYRSAAAGPTSGTAVTRLTGSVPAGGHYLVQQAKGSGGSTPLPAPDATGGTAMSAGSGVVYLVDGTAAVTPAKGDVRDPQNPGPATVDLVGFGSADTVENRATPAATGTPAPSNTTSVSRSLGADADDNSGDFAAGAPAPQNTGSPTGPPPPPPPPAPAPRVTVGEIQGTGWSSPISGQRVLTRGVVTAAYPAGGLGGFMIQEAGSGTAAGEGSQAVFVAGAGAVAAMTDGVEVGDHVDVYGTVREQFGLTSLSPSRGNEVVPLDTPAAVSPLATTWPGDDVTRERLEGMLLAPQGAFTVADNYDLNQYAEIGLASGTEPLRQPTDVAPFGSAEAEAVERVNREKAVLLDDGADLNFLRDAKNTPLPWLTGDRTIRVGDPVAFDRPVVLGYGFGDWRFWPTEQVTAGDVNESDPVSLGETRTPAPAPVGGDLQVASFNVLNYFTALGDQLPGCRFFTDRVGDPVTVSGGCDARGAAETEDFERQEAKIVDAINTLGAEVVSLSEIENSARFGKDRDQALATLVDALNEDLGREAWAFVPSPAAAPDPAEEDAIRNAFIYQPADVRPVGESRIRPSVGESDPFVNARDPLAQVFQPVGAVRGDRFMLVVNHFKSKGSPPPAVDDPNDDYGQGAWNVRRVEQARALTEWVKVLRDELGVAKIYLDGDFNSYTFEDPMLALYGAGYTNLAERFDGGESYLFGGRVGSLDHGLANQAALQSTTGATVWNINSSEPVALEYSRHNYNATDFYADGPYRSSDHDPVIFGIDTRRR